MAGAGTAGALIGAIACAFAVLSTVVAVGGWPLAPSAPGVATLEERGGAFAADSLLRPLGPLPDRSTLATRSATAGAGVRWIATAGGRTRAAVVGGMPDAGTPDLRAGDPADTRRAPRAASAAGAIPPPGRGSPPEQPLPDTGGAGAGAGTPPAPGGGSSSLGGAVTQVASGAGTAVAQTGQQLGGAVQGATAQLGGTVGQVSPAAGQVVTQTGQVAGGAVGGITGAAGQVVSGAGTAVGGLLGGLGGAGTSRAR